METLKQKAVTSAIAMLKAAGAEYKIVFEGQTYGEAPKQMRKRQPRQHLVKEYLDPMQIGDYCLVPNPGNDDINRLQQTVCNYASKLWGAGSYMTSRAADGGIEVIRKS